MGLLVLNAMAINNQSQYIRNIVPFGPIEMACRRLGRRMAFTDIDMEREIHGRWIRAEWKSEGVEIPRGQEINFERLTATQLTTVIEIWGENGIPTRYRIVGQMQQAEPCTLVDIARLFLDWEDWARRQPWPEVTAKGDSITISASPAWVWSRPAWMTHGGDRR